MKKPILLILLIFSSFINAQKEIDSTKVLSKKTSSEDSITRKEFTKILNLQFSKIITGTNFANFGNYASITSTDESLKVSASFLGKKGDIISFEASGGATEGIAGFFNNGKLNSNISGKLTYHILFNPFSSRSVSRNSFERDKLREEFEKIENTYKADSIAVEHEKELLDLIAEIVKSEQKGSTIQDSLTAVLSRLNIKRNSKDLFKLDSLKYEKEKISFDLDVLSKKREKVESDDYFLEKLEKLNQKYDEDLLANEKKVIAQAIRGINICWISFGYGIRNDGFRFFDKSLELDNQIKKMEAATHEINFAVSHYNWQSYSPTDIYWSFGASYRLGNNLGALENLKVRDSESISSNPNRESFTDQSVFVGDFQDNINEITLFFDYYRFFGQSDQSNFALHINPSVLYKDGSRPLTSFQTGLVIPFKKTDDQSTFLNIEVFYKLNDFFNTSDSENSLLGRNTIGLAATFPINFLTNKSN